MFCFRRRPLFAAMNIRLYDPSKIKININKNYSSSSVADEGQKKEGPSTYADLRTIEEKYAFFSDCLNELFAEEHHSSGIIDALPQKEEELFDDYGSNFAKFNGAFDDIVAHLKALISNGDVSATSDLTNWQKLIHVTHVKKKYENLVQCFYDYLREEEAVEAEFFGDTFLRLKTQIATELRALRDAFHQRNQRVLHFYQAKMQQIDSLRECESQETVARMKDVVENETNKITSTLLADCEASKSALQKYYVSGVFVSHFQTEFVSKMRAAHVRYLKHKDEILDAIKKYKQIIFENTPDTVLNAKFIKVDKYCAEILELVQSNFDKNKKLKYSRYRSCCC